MVPVQDEIRLILKSAIQGESAQIRYQLDYRMIFIGASPKASIAFQHRHSVLSHPQLEPLSKFRSGMPVAKAAQSWWLKAQRRVEKTISAHLKNVFSAELGVAASNQLLEIP
jgi:hypothetical protein